MKNTAQKKIFLTAIAAVCAILALCAAFGVQTFTGTAEDTIGSRGEASCMDELELKLICSGKYVKIRLWLDEDAEEGFFFMPAGTQEGSLSLLYDEACGSVSLDKAEVRSGQNIPEPERGREAELCFKGTDGSEETCTVTFMQSENLPALFISTESGDMDYLRDDKENKEAGTLLLVRPDGLQWR